MRTIKAVIDEKISNILFRISYTGFETRTSFTTLTPGGTVNSFRTFSMNSEFMAENFCKMILSISVHL